jgi:hypothetical protein
MELQNLPYHTCGEKLLTDLWEIINQYFKKNLEVGCYLVVGIEIAIRSGVLS